MKTNFSPLTHGYSFANRFEFKGLAKFKKIINSNLVYGMCGGMVFTALDYYFDQKVLPDYSNPNTLPDNYAKYLWKRQSESVTFSIFIKILFFSVLSKSSSFSRSINKELPIILNRIIDGLPAPIVIIRSNIFQNPTHNHQVLVVGFQYQDSNLHLSLYDPNHPCKNPVLVITQNPEIKILQTTGEPVRGFFLNKYSYKKSNNQF